AAPRELMASALPKIASDLARLERHRRDWALCKSRVRGLRRRGSSRSEVSTVPNERAARKGLCQAVDRVYRQEPGPVLARRGRPSPRDPRRPTNSLDRDTRELRAETADARRLRHYNCLIRGGSGYPEGPSRSSRKSGPDAAAEVLRALL